MQQAEDEDDFMIPLTVEYRLSSFTDRYFVKQYHNNQYVYQHSNKLFIIGLTPKHPIILSNSEIATLVYPFKVDNVNDLVRGKKKRGGIRVSPNSLLATITLKDGTVHQVFSLVEGFIIEINENAQKYLLSHPLDKGFIAVIQPNKNYKPGYSNEY